MEALDQLDELLSCRLDAGRKTVKPSTIVIFGASGDLTARKLIPALYHLFLEKQLPEPFRIVGFARRPKTDAAWRDDDSEEELAELLSERTGSPSRSVLVAPARPDGGAARKIFDAAWGVRNAGVSCFQSIDPVS